MTRLAIFDFDGTILSGNSWHEFFRSELRRRPARAPLLLAAYALRRSRWWSGERLREFALRGLRGLPASTVAGLGEQLHATRLARQVRAAALTEIERRRAAGYRIVIATGTFDFAVAPFARSIGADLVVATKVAFENGRCLGRVAGPETLGPTKAAAVQVASKAWGEVDWAGSCAFTDAAIDRALLALVGEPVLVTSSPELPPEFPAEIRRASWETPA